jgi:glutamate N-acetyltransferase/amino-acid N-acetyltransferase
MSGSVSPLAPKSFADMPPVRGVRMATAAAGIKYKNRTDVLLMVFDEPAAVAGVFTKSRCPSAPVDFCRQNLGGGIARAVVVNSGNANAFTGKKGKAATELTAQSASEAVGCSTGEVFLASTGVIGEPLDATKFAGVLSDMTTQATGDFWFEAAKAIMTTDTYPKVVDRDRQARRHDVTINGIAKGAGMIAPDMATMLSFVATDAPIAAGCPAGPVVARHGQDLQRRHRRQRHLDLRHADAVCHRAAAKRGQRQRSSPQGCGVSEAFRRALEQDAEIAGAASGARRRRRPQAGRSHRHRRKSARSAKRIGLSIANSPLVKTAVAGEDANWGRVVMAVGKAGELADRDRLSIWFGDNGARIEWRA